MTMIFKYHHHHPPLQQINQFSLYSSLISRELGSVIRLFDVDTWLIFQTAYLNLISALYAHLSDQQTLWISYFVIGNV